MPRLTTLEVVQTGARRRWPVEEKLRIVAESDRGPGAVSATARRYGVSPAQLFTWRRQVRTGQLTAEGFNGFVPACVVADGGIRLNARSHRQHSDAGPDPTTMVANFGKASSSGSFVSAMPSPH